MSNFLRAGPEPGRVFGSHIVGITLRVHGRDETQQFKTVGVALRSGRVFNQSSQSDARAGLDILFKRYVWIRRLEVVTSPSKTSCFAVQPVNVAGVSLFLDQFSSDFSAATALPSQPIILP